MPSNWVLPKWSGSYADTLAAVGLAILIENLCRDGRQVTIRQRSDAFEITGPPIDYEEVDWETVQLHPLFQYVKIKEPDEELPLQYFDYLEQKRLADLQREWSKQSKKAKQLQDMESERPDGPEDRFYHFQRVHMLQGFGARNKLYLDIQRADARSFRSTLIDRLTQLEEGQARSVAKTAFQPSVSALQVFNPTVGKGINRPKADGAARGTLSGSYVDWFEEWLRFIGSDHLLYGFSIGDDIKISVPVPADISIDKLKLLAAEKGTNAWHSRKVDLFVVMDQVEFLLNQSGMKAANPWISFGQRPNEVISAVQTGYFKSLGSGKAVTNISSIGLPGWFPVKTSEDVELWKTLLGEHRKILQMLDEVKSEEAALLGIYRDFLSASDWKAFLEFLGAYGCLVIRRREKQPIRSFTIKHLEGLLMRAHTHLPIADVIRNEGFRNVAAAMKQATVGEQMHKSRGAQVFDIKYGLFQEIKRKARFPEQLIAAVAAFISEYNYENARRAEQLKNKGGRRRKSVSVDDLDKLNQLFIDHPSPNASETIAMLLIAYASAASGERADQQENQEEA